MSTIKVDTIRNYDSAVDFSQGFKLGGADVIQNYTESADMPETPTPVNGDYWWDTANEVLYRYMDGGFRALGIAASSIAWGGDRGVFAAGYGQVNTFTANIDYIDITTAANAQDFGDCTSIRYTGCGVSNGSRGVFMGGGDTGGAKNFIDYITISTTGNATDFGDLIFEVYYSAGVSDATKGFCCGGARGQAGGYARIDNIQYITIATTGNATDGANLTAVRTHSSGWNDATRAVIMGGFTTGNASVNSIDYFTMSSLSGNATDFGDLTATVDTVPGSGGDATYALCAGGRRSGSSNANGWSENIDRITIQTTGNATDFGDLQTFKSYVTGASNGTSATFAGGDTNNGSNIRTDQIDLVTVATPGNATDFGNLIQGKEGAYGASGAAS